MGSEVTYMDMPVTKLRLGRAKRRLDGKKEQSALLELMDKKRCWIIDGVIVDGGKMIISSLVCIVLLDQLLNRVDVDLWVNLHRQPIVPFNEIPETVARIWR